MEPAEIFMQRCLDLALPGLGKVAPNPLVGAVLVFDNKIIGEGYHQVFGGPHAEMMAISQASKFYSEKELIQSVLYVNLEPCNHSGKTPPCCKSIIHHKIKRVVISTPDPNPLVKGNGMVAGHFDLLDEQLGEGGVIHW